MQNVCSYCYLWVAMVCSRSNLAQPSMRILRPADVFEFDIDIHYGTVVLELFDYDFFFEDPRIGYSRIPLEVGTAEGVKDLKSLRLLDSESGGALAATVKYTICLAPHSEFPGLCVCTCVCVVLPARFARVLVCMCGSSSCAIHIPELNNMADCAQAQADTHARTRVRTHTHAHSHHNLRARTYTHTHTHTQPSLRKKSSKLKYFH